MPESKLADQLPLVEAIALAFRREVGQPAQRQPRFRALAGLPLDGLDRLAPAWAVAIAAMVSGFTVTVRPYGSAIS